MKRQKIEPVVRATSVIANAFDPPHHSLDSDSPIVAHRRGERSRLYRYQPRAEGRM